MSETNTALPYADVPWLTEERLAEMMRSLEDYGSSEFGAYEGKPDWDWIIDQFDSIEEPLPTDWDHPLIKAMQKAWRAGKRGAA